MTIEAKLDRTNELLAELLEKFAHIGAATRVPQGASQQGKAGDVDVSDIKARRAEEDARRAQEKKPEPKVDGAALNYEKDIKPIALALAKKDRAKLTAIWKELGVNVGTELKPEQFAQAKKLIEAA